MSDEFDAARDVSFHDIAGADDLHLIQALHVTKTMIDRESRSGDAWNGLQLEVDAAIDLLTERSGDVSYERNQVGDRHGRVATHGDAVDRVRGALMAVHDRPEDESLIASARDAVADLRQALTS